MANYVEFTQWLEEELKQRGMSKSELARRGSINLSHLQRVLAGERKPGPNTCSGIARALHIPVEEVFRRAGVLPKSRRISTKLEELQFHFNNLSEEDQERVLIFVRALDEARTVSNK